MTAFRQVVGKLQEGRREEAMIGLEFVLRLDPSFGPARNLQQQLGSGASEIDLSEIIGQLQAPTTEAINGALIEAVDCFNQRQFLEAKERVEGVLADLPGHPEARQLLAQIQDSLKLEAQVGQFLTQSRQALDLGDPQEAANFVMMAQALDPHNPGIQPMLEQIQAAAPPLGGVEPADGFGTGVEADDGPSFESLDAGEVAPFGFEDSGFGVSGSAPAGDGSFDDAGASSSFEASFDEPSGFDVSGEPGAAAAAGDGAFGGADGAFGGADGAFGGAGGAFGGAGEPGGSDDFADPSAFSDLGDPGAFGDDAAQDGMWDAPSAGDSAFNAESFDAESFDAEGAAGGSGAGDLFGAALSEAGDADMFQADELQAGGGISGDAEAVELSAEDQTKIEQLLQRGAKAFDESDFQEAIDVWSRIFLIHPTHQEANQRIDQARLRKDELDRQLEHTIYDARDALEGGDADRARHLVAQVLAIQPNHIEAAQLQEELGGAEPAPGAIPAAQTPPVDDTYGVPDLPDLDDDLFSEDLPPAGDLGSGAFPEADLDAVPAAPPKKAGGGRSALPMRWVILSVCGLVVILLGVWFGQTLLSTETDDLQESVAQLNQVLERADGLAEQNQVSEAIHLLQEYPASGMQQGRIAKRIERYQALQRPTPTPIPQALTAAEEHLRANRLLSAFAEVERGLQDNPLDEALLELKEEIRRREPQIPNLNAALQAENYRAVVSLGQELVERNPNVAELATAYERSLFNAALLELRAYNLSGAEGHLRVLAARRPDDEEVGRVLEFVDTYKARPVDMRLKVFISNLKLR